jgi:hypothetical protein
MNRRWTRSAMLSGAWDKSRYAMEARILRPLLWFGSAKRYQTVSSETTIFIERAQLFDRLLIFAVPVELSEDVRH